MTKEKLNKLKVYLDQIASKLMEKIPSKHSLHPESYQNFLRNEIRMTKLKIEQAELGK